MILDSEGASQAIETNYKGKKTHLSTVCERDVVLLPLCILISLLFPDAQGLITAGISGLQEMKGVAISQHTKPYLSINSHCL